MWQIRIMLIDCEFSFLKHLDEFEDKKIKNKNKKKRVGSIFYKILILYLQWRGVVEKYKKSSI